MTSNITFTDAIKAMRDFIAAEITVMKSGAFKQYHGWHSLNHFIVETGQEFEPTPLPDTIAYMEQKQCYRNATMLMIDDPDRFVYCEGVGLTSWWPMHHAWVWDRSRRCVVDPTWRFDNDHPPSAYIGIPFTEAYVRTALVDKETYGLVDDWTGRWPLLSLDPSEYRAAL